MTACTYLNLLAAMGALLVASSFVIFSLNVSLVTPGDHESPATSSTGPVSFRSYLSANLVPSTETTKPATTPDFGLFSAMVFDAANGDVYVADWDSANVTVIDGATGAVVKNITVGLDPDALAVEGTQGNVYVASSGSRNLSVISGATNAVVTTISVGYGASALAFDPANGDIYVTTSGTCKVSVIDATTNTVIDAVPVACSDESLALDSATGAVYVGNWAGGPDVNVINGTTNTIATNISLTAPGSNEPWSLAYDPANGEIYAPENNTDYVAVINGTTNHQITTVDTTGYSPRLLAADPVNGDVYVNASDTIDVISGQTNSVVATIPVGSHPIAVVVDDTTGDVFVANQGSDNVTVINGSTNTLIESVPTGSEPSSVAVDSTTGAVYISDYGSHNVTEISGPIHPGPANPGPGAPQLPLWTEFGIAVAVIGSIGVGTALVIRLRVRKAR